MGHKLSRTEIQQLQEKAKDALELADQFRQAANELDELNNKKQNWVPMAQKGLAAVGAVVSNAGIPIGTVCYTLSTVVPGLAHFINQILENKVIRDLNPQWNSFREKFGVDMANVREKDIEQQLTELFGERVPLIEKAQDVYAEVKKFRPYQKQTVLDMSVDRAPNYTVLAMNLYDLISMCFAVYNNSSESSQMGDSFRKVADKLNYIAEEAEAKAKKGKK